MGIHERKEREKEHRREEILDAAQTVFFGKGLAVATMDEIAETAELSKGTLYLYYKSKEDLYLAVMMRGMELMYEKFRNVLKADDSVPGNILRLADAYLDYYYEHRDYFRMMHYLQTPQFHKQVTEEMKTSCNDLNQRIWDLVVTLLKRGIDEGYLRPDLDPVAVSIILWSSATSLMSRADTQHDLWKERFHIDLNTMVRLSIKLLLEAIFTEKGKTELTAWTKT